MKTYLRGLSYRHIEGEIWKDIPGYEGLYQASNFGRIKSLPRKASPRDFLLRFATRPDGYPGCALVKNRKPASFTVHRLIAMTFLSPKKDNLEINHIDGNKLNNMVENLEWCTRSENLKHCFRIGLKDQHGDNHHQRKLYSWQVREIRQKFKPLVYTRRMLATEYNVSEATIKAIVERRNWLTI